MDYCDPFPGSEHRVSFNIGGKVRRDIYEVFGLNYGVFLREGCSNKIKKLISWEHHNKLQVLSTDLRKINEFSEN